MENLEDYFHPLPNGGIRMGLDGYISKSKLNIGKSISIEFDKPMPNRWYRFWYKFLLNWTWENL